ncbi:hypothetical protein DL96DRAFT_1573743 [Flagelloscypha sp. PMI_526]|nr:hypothetical protein DL96DRAFT_1573743 [Flagelloscypha sp. PMI_526]
MTSRLSQLLGLKSPVSPPPVEDEWYIPYKASQDSMGTDASGRKRSKTTSLALGGVGQSPEPVYSPSPPLSTIFSSLAVRRSSSAKATPFRSTSTKPAPQISRSNSAVTQSSTHSRPDIIMAHRPSHSSDFNSNQASWPNRITRHHELSPVVQPLIPPPTPDNPQPLRPEFPHVNSKDLLRSKSLRAHDEPASLPSPAFVEEEQPQRLSPPIHPYANVYSIHEEPSPYTAPRAAPLPSFSPSPGGPSYFPNCLALTVCLPKLLSAQNWCDTFLLPRPRLKGRAISITPPDSPQQIGATSSHVLTHSRSLVNMRQEPKLMPVTAQIPAIPSIAGPSRQLHPPRPKSFALDDLALPSPIPSLSTVLQEGELLQHQRHKWQTMAISSIGNRHSRSLSRARSKSLTQRHKPKDKDNSFTYLAARGLLGDQEAFTSLPIYGTAISPAPQSSDGHGTYHTSQSKAHSRNSSWAKNAIKACVDPDVSPALQQGGTKRIKMPDPATAENHLSVLSPLSPFTPRPPQGAVSIVRDFHNKQSSPGEAPMYIPPWRNPSPKGPSVSPIPPDLQMGIAVSTPPEPLFDEEEDPDQDIDYMPSHPYASSAGNYRGPISRGNANHKKSGSVGSDYAGAHPIISPTVQYRPGHNPSASYTARFSSHPYASGSSTSTRDSYISESKVIPVIRPDSEIPLPEKMWAALSPTGNFAREILPNEIHSYSPYGTTPEPPEITIKRHSGEFNGPVASGSQISRFRRELSVQQEEPEEPEDTSRVPSQTPSASPSGSVSRRGWRKPVAYGSIDAGRGVPPGTPSGDEDVSPSPIPSVHRPTEYLLSSHGQSSKMTTQTLPSSIGDGIVPHLHADVPTSNREVTQQPVHLGPSTSLQVSTSFAGPSATLSPPSLSPVHEKSGSSGSTSHNPSSPDVTSRGSSPPRPIGSVDDLDDFEDLFYRPNRATMSIKTGDSNDHDSIARESGLTSIARQLEREFKEMNAELGTLPDSEYEMNHRDILEDMEFGPPSGDLAGVNRQAFHPQAASSTMAEDHTFGFQANADDMYEDESHFDGFEDSLNHRPTFVPFQSTTTLPEDVEQESSRASSPDHEAVFFRVGHVESVVTPPANFVSHRPTSSVGEMSYALPSSVGTTYTMETQRGSPPPHPTVPQTYFEPMPGSSSEPRHVSLASSSVGKRDSLHPSMGTPRFSTEDGMFRRSYMTTSEGSRMSGLSDFPVPPLHYPPEFRRDSRNESEHIGERPSMIIDSYMDRPLPEEDEDDHSRESSDYKPEQQEYDEDDDTMLRPPA